MGKTAGKRLRPGHSSSDSESEEEILASFDAFIVIESEDQRDFSNISPFVIEKALLGAVGTIKTAKKLRDGKLLVEVLRPKQSLNLQKLVAFCDLKVKVYPHKTLNSSKGVIRDRRYFCCSEEELVHQWQSQGVTHVRRIMTRKDGTLKPTNSLVLTFNSPKCPTRLKVCYGEVISISPYIPNPLRCFSCQKFGHHENSCKNSPVCGKCAGADRHDEASCDRPAKCANCGGSHSARSNQCPVWVKEKEITRVKCTHNISYPEARKMVGSVPSTSFTTIVKSAAKRVPMKDAQTQTVDASTQTSESASDIPSHKGTSISAKTTEKPKLPPKPSGTPEPSTGKNVTPKGTEKPQGDNWQKVSAEKAVKPASRTKKGSDTDPITSKNQYGVLAEESQDQMDYNDSSQSARGSRHRSRSPILPP